MDTTALLFVGILAAGAVVLVALPFLREPVGSAERREEHATRVRLRFAERRDRALAALKELEFDHRTGKLSGDDYRELVGPLRREAAAALRRVDDRSRGGS